MAELLVWRDATGSADRLRLHSPHPDTRGALQMNPLVHGENNMIGTFVKQFLATTLSFLLSSLPRRSKLEHSKRGMPVKARR